MKKVVQIFFVFMIIHSVSFGQGIVRGKITDENGESVIGATIVLKSRQGYGVATDLDGNYSLKIADTTSQTLVISSISYKTIEETVYPVHGEVIIKNFVLLSAAQTMKEVQIVAKVVKAKEYYFESIKKKSSTTIDYVSAETMKKTGDVSVVSAVARVSGVSTNGGFITVRGIGDRYVKTGINGSRIPTLDPFTNNIKLDLFPASLVDNIVITKTASPDLPGDWAGAYLSVETKDYPENLAVNFETSVGYNSQSTFKDFISSQRSSTDWLGYDNGLRDHNHNTFSLANISPSQYQQFVALGLGPYYNNLGVTDQNWTADHANGDTYYKLGLVQLGLLAPAQLNDAIAFGVAKNTYLNSSYVNQAFSVINADAVKTGQSFPDSWNTINRKAPLDFSQSFSIGNQVNFLGKPLGFLGGFRYSSSVQSYPNSIAQRPYAVSGLIQSSREQVVSRETNGWSALFNLAYKLNPNNSISFLFMPNLIGTNNVRRAYDNLNYNTTLTQFYEQRRQLVYQFKSEHYLPGKKIKIESNASYTRGKSNAPDFRVLEYKDVTITNTIVLDPTNDPADRYYRYLSDNLFDSRISAELPLEDKPGLSRKLKVGASYQDDNQRSDRYNYHLNIGNAGSLPQSGSIDDILSLDNFAISNGTIPWYYSRELSPLDHTFGKSSVKAAFVMLDYTILPPLRISGGLRIEHAKIYTDVNEYDSLGYPRNDIRRNYDPGKPDANPGNLNEVSYLPSANIIYKLRDDEFTPVNVRLNFSGTVARPSIRELSEISVYDYELQAPVTGNADLKMVKIRNYDLRLESYFKNGDNVSLSLFYKNFKNHIELEYSDSYYWQNVDQSHVAGIELEIKKAITKHFEFRTNVTFVNSTTTFVRTRNESVGGIKTIYYEDTVKRPMFGQAPFILNGILGYNSDTLGLTFTLSYNIQGPRLVIASNNKAIPDVYELPRNLLDFKCTKKFGKHLSASFTMRNILNAPVRRSYKYPEGYTLDYDRYRYGTNYVFGIAYKI